MTLAWSLRVRGFDIKLTETDWMKEYNEIVEQYPMLELLKNAELNESQSNTLFDYVRLMDSRTN